MMSSHMGGHMRVYVCIETVMRVKAMHIMQQLLCANSWGLSRAAKKAQRCALPSRGGGCADVVCGTRRPQTKNQTQPQAAATAATGAWLAGELAAWCGCNDVQV
jgi:hypothetical protein